VNVALWAVQIMLAAAFVLAGYPKAFMPIARIAKQMTWTAAAPPALVRFIGVAELLGALGLLLPALTRIQPWLTPLAAAGLALIMVLASAFNFTRKQSSHVTTNLVLLAMALVVVWGRFALAPL
jgi:putative oxidoreductase